MSIEFIRTCQNLSEEPPEILNSMTKLENNSLRWMFPINLPRMSSPVILPSTQTSDPLLEHSRELSPDPPFLALANLAKMSSAERRKESMSFDLKNINESYKCCEQSQWPISLPCICLSITINLQAASSNQYHYCMLHMKSYSIFTTLRYLAYFTPLHQKRR